MKNFTVKASALAIAAALPGLASAAIDLQLGTGSLTYASELVPSSGATVQLTDPEDTDGITAPLGFGVSNLQDRYIRFDLTGAKWASAVGAGMLQVDSDCSGNAGDDSATETVVKGGAANGTFVIFQITASVNDGLGAETPVCLDLNAGAGDRITLTSAASASIKYSLYATPADAAIGLQAGLLDSTTGTIAGTAPALQYSVTPGVSTADVAALPAYAAFDKSGNALATAIGGVSLGVDPDVRELDGDAVMLSSIVSNANWVVSGEDLASLGANGITAALPGQCGLSSLAVGTVASATSRVIDTNTTEIAGADICYIANGKTAISAQDFTVSLDFDRATGSSVADVSAQALGTFERNGTVLKAPIMSGAGGQNTWIQVANMSSSAAPWVVQCFSPTGSKGAGASGTLPAGTTAKLFYSSLGCAAGSNAVELIINAPIGNVVGTLVRQSTTTGDSALDSLTGNQ